MKLLSTFLTTKSMSILIIFGLMLLTACTTTTKQTTDEVAQANLKVPSYYLVSNHPLTYGSASVAPELELATIY